TLKVDKINEPPTNEFEIDKAFKSLVKKTEAELVAYFESRIWPDNHLPAEIDRQFTEKLGSWYDDIDEYFYKQFGELDSPILSNVIALTPIPIVLVGHFLVNVERILDI
uniref:Uncharacterized protein n=1 Tax=Acrobeloides nanus TaxID=290746 RepID=A0A914EJY4_9BILA